jgi:hypothetical protein
MAGGKQRDWRELCAAVTNEPDSKKLDSLVQELIRALDEGEQNLRRRINSWGSTAIATSHDRSSPTLCPTFSFLQTSRSQPS